MGTRWRGVGRAAARLLIVAVAVVGCTDDPAPDGAAPTGAVPSEVAVEVVSTRAEYVTGGDALVAVTVPDGTDPTQVSLAVDGTPVEVELSAGDDDRLLGLVTGLPDGPSELTATVGDATAKVAVVGHPTTGPLLSGPHLPLAVCTTEGYGLGPATDDDCSAPTVVRWSYRSTDGTFKPLDDPAARPDDLAEARPGVPFIVREEQGTANRGIYWIRVLEPDPTGADGFDDGGWNQRLVYAFGGGCGVTYTQGFALLSEPNPELLAEGYAFATSTFNTFQVHCNDVLSAETALMVKERFVEGYGLPDHTIGFGGSGGAIQQYLIAQDYPGILDGVGAVVPFPDAVSIAPGVVDCNLLNAWYATPTGAALTPEQRAAVNGHLTAGTCDFWQQTFGRNVDPQAGCSLALFRGAGGAIPGLPEGGVPEPPAELVYDPDENPDGLRCTLQDGSRNLVGADPATGFALRPLDNVGVQYGLGALNDGAIDVDAFLALNEQIGGYDLDGRPTAERMEAPEEALAAAYATGRIIVGDGPLSEVPVISVDVWTDDQGDIHDRLRAFSLRDRLGADAPGHVIWTRGLPAGDSLVSALTGTVALDVEVVHVLDDWLTALAADPDGTVADRLARTRPADAVDNCVTADGERVSGVDLYDGPGPCTDPYPVSDDPRTAAGAPRANDVIACALQPVAEAMAGGTYQVELTPDQVQRLERIFPDGVCDWSQPGRGQVAFAGPWQDFGDG